MEQQTRLSKHLSKRTRPHETLEGVLTGLHNTSVEIAGRRVIACVIPNVALLRSTTLDLLEPDATSGSLHLLKTSTCDKQNDSDVHKFIFPAKIQVIKVTYSQVFPGNSPQHPAFL